MFFHLIHLHVATRGLEVVWAQLSLSVLTRHYQALSYCAWGFPRREPSEPEEAPVLASPGPCSGDVHFGRLHVSLHDALLTSLRCFLLCEIVLSQFLIGSNFYEFNSISWTGDAHTQAPVLRMGLHVNVSSTTQYSGIHRECGFI